MKVATGTRRSAYLRRILHQDSERLDNTVAVQVCLLLPESDVAESSWNEIYSVKRSSQLLSLITANSEVATSLRRAVPTSCTNHRCQTEKGPVHGLAWF